MAKRFNRFIFQPCIPLGKDGAKVTASREHISLSRKAASEGMVLLKNEGRTLPFKKGTRIALFGSASYDYVKGGGGSGDVYCPFTRSLFEGFGIKEEEKKIEIFKPLSDFYSDFVKKEKKWVRDNYSRLNDEVNRIPEGVEREIAYGKMLMSIQLKQPPIPEELLKSAREFTDTAVMSISRYSGEFWDRSNDKGDFRLSDGEAALAERLSKTFDKVIAVLNVGGVVDTSWIKENANVKGALLSWQAGMEGGLATADILCGDVNPSGKLSDTFALELSDYPSTEHFNDSHLFVEYNEDIYVGYRYFETIPGAATKVAYPFGYGLSYTDFDISAEAYDDSHTVTVKAVVKNTGKVAGKETVQVYYSAPQGVLGKPARELAAFKKTKLLVPGETQELTLCFKISDMASFDDLGKLKKSAYLLEKGEYKLFVGNSVRNCWELEHRIVIKDDPLVVCQLESRCAPIVPMDRLKSDGSFERLPGGKLKNEWPIRNRNTAKAPENPVSLDKVGKDITVDEFIARMDDDELRTIVGGCKRHSGVCNTGSFGGIDRLGIPAFPTADGPAGVRINEDCGVAATAWPCATLLACTFDTDLIFEVGVAGGRELKENNLAFWLTPGMNIHRNPMCGRNFEYYSEDPLLTGKSASAMVRGIQSQKVGASAKHFAANNKEIRRILSDSRVSERALREIYLKGFEICVKEADPWTIMSSYNLINGRHTSENYELLYGILRGEWGFKGFVTTDWGIKNDPVSEVRAGNDMKMRTGYPEDLKKAMDEGVLKREDLEDCARHIISVFTRFD